MTIQPLGPRASVDSAVDEQSRARLGGMLRSAMSAAVLPHKLRLLNIEASHRLAGHQSHYNPDQPRVPAGHPDGGQWTNVGANAGIRLAAAEKPVWVQCLLPSCTWA